MIAAGAVVGGQAGAAEDTIKIGVLHSPSGTMAISETTLKDTMLMLVDDLNNKGELLAKDKVAVVFGNWTSVSRKSVPPVFEELNGLLF